MLWNTVLKVVVALLKLRKIQQRAKIQIRGYYRKKKFSVLINENFTNNSKIAFLTFLIQTLIMQ